MRNDVIRWAGISAFIFLVAAIIGFVVEGISGVDVYQEDVAEMLADIDDNEGAFAFSRVWSMATSIFFFPILLGLFFALREEDRPWMVLASIFFIVGGAFFILSSGFALALTDVGSDFVKAVGSTREAILREGELLQSLFFASFLGWDWGFAIGVLLTGLLMLRGTFFPRWLAGLTVLLGIVGLPVFLWFIFLPGLALWLLLIGWTMWRKGEGKALNPLARPAAA